MEWWKLSARCNALAGDSPGEEEIRRQTQQDQSSGVMEDTTMTKLY